MKENHQKRLLALLLLGIFVALCYSAFSGWAVTDTQPQWSLLLPCLAGSLASTALILGFGQVWSIDTVSLSPRPEGESALAATTVGGSALVVLFGGADFLDTVFGKPSAQAASVVAVASVLTAVATGLAPLLLRLIGETEKDVTPWGLVLSNGLVITASIFQVNVVTTQIVRLAGPHSVAIATMLVAAVVLVVVGLSSRAAFRGLQNASKAGREQRQSAMF